MSDLRKAAEQAIAALESVEVVGGEVFRVASDCHYAIEALRAALAEQPQPVATVCAGGDVAYGIVSWKHSGERPATGALLYAAPPTREPVRLTKEQIERIRLEICDVHALSRLAADRLARAVEDAVLAANRMKP